MAVAFNGLAVGLRAKTRSSRRLLSARVSIERSPRQRRSFAAEFSEDSSAPSSEFRRNRQTRAISGGLLSRWEK